MKILQAVVCEIPFVFRIPKLSNLECPGMGTLEVSWSFGDQNRTRPKVVLNFGSSTDSPRPQQIICDLHTPPHVSRRRPPGKDVSHLLFVPFCGVAWRSASNVEA